MSSGRISPLKSVNSTLTQSCKFPLRDFPLGKNKCLASCIMSDFVELCGISSLRFPPPKAGHTSFPLCFQLISILLVAFSLLRFDVLATGDVDTAPSSWVTRSLSIAMRVLLLVTVDGAVDDSFTALAAKFLTAARPPSSGKYSAKVVSLTLLIVSMSIWK